MLQVLIVEDNAAYRESLRQLVAESFPAVGIFEAGDGEDALNKTMSLRFGLIFMDIRLPVGNGLDLTRIIKQAYPDTVICVISSYAMLEYKEAALRNGADHFMVKGESTAAQRIIELIESLLRAPLSASLAQRASD